MVNPYKIKNVFMGKLTHGSDILTELTNFCRKNEIKTGILTAIGAVKNAALGFYNQDEKKYYKHCINQPLEIVSLSGNISIKDEKPMVHSHIVLSDKDGNTVGGHLMSDTIVFASEFWIFELEGERLIRGYDEVTGLPLWEMKKNRS